MQHARLVPRDFTTLSARALSLRRAIGSIASSANCAGPSCDSRNRRSQSRSSASSAIGKQPVTDAVLLMGGIAWRPPRMPSPKPLSYQMLYRRMAGADRVEDEASGRDRASRHTARAIRGLMMAPGNETLPAGRGPSHQAGKQALRRAAGSMRPVLRPALGMRWTRCTTGDEERFAERKSTWGRTVYATALLATQGSASHERRATHSAL